MNTDVIKSKNETNGCNECVIVPPVDIFEKENEFIVRADMPGVSRDRLEVTLDNHELVISGTIEKNDDADYLKYSEYALYNFYRKFVVNNDIDAKDISAALANGVLTLTLPKHEAAKPRRIEIATA